MQSLDQFIQTTGLRMTARRVYRNPHMEDDKWHAEASHWRCTIIAGPRKQRMTITFSMGSAHTEPPTLPDVLDCLASDASGIVNRDFKDWCSEYGYDTDSRKAERTFNACQRQAYALNQVLGGQDYDTLLWHTERL